MMSKAYLAIKLLSLTALMLITTSCAVTTRSFEGTSETLDNTSDASTDFTSSTSIREKENKIDQDQQILAYAESNLERLREEMARGGGEHLTAFAYLLGIKESHQAEFFIMTKEKYPELFSTEPTTARQLVDRLNKELRNYPEWR